MLLIVVLYEIIHSLVMFDSTFLLSLLVLFSIVFTITSFLNSSPVVIVVILRK